MSSAPNSPTQTRFFGLDLASLWSDLAVAWRGMMDWPALSWLWPQSEVRLCLPTGDLALSHGLDARPVQDQRRAQSARFEAIVLPEKLLLRRTLSLPELQPSELRAALSLEVQSLSPFPLDELTWTHEVASRHSGTLSVDIVLCSRKLIAQHLETVQAQLKSQNPEVWIPSARGPGFLLLSGFGEARRQRESAMWRSASAVLALLALTLLLAIAVTPSAQLYLRALQANQAMTVLGQKAAAAIAQRETLVQASERLTDLTRLINKSVPPLQILKLITESLPDDTSLLSLQIQGLKVIITGQTVNAAALMKQLGGTPGLREVKAPIPATKPLGAQRESFTIEFMLDPAKLNLAS